MWSGVRWGGLGLGWAELGGAGWGGVGLGWAGRGGAGWVGRSGVGWSEVGWVEMRCGVMLHCTATEQDMILSNVRPCNVVYMQ